MALNFPAAAAPFHAAPFHLPEVENPVFSACGQAAIHQRSAGSRKHGRNIRSGAEYADSPAGSAASGNQTDGVSRARTEIRNLRAKSGGREYAGARGRDLGRPGDGRCGGAARIVLDLATPGGAQQRISELAWQMLKRRGDPSAGFHPRIRDSLASRIGGRQSNRSAGPDRALAGTPAQRRGGPFPLTWCGGITFSPVSSRGRWRSSPERRDCRSGRNKGRAGR